LVGSAITGYTYMEAKHVIGNAVVTRLDCRNKADGRYCTW
jgi:hypothetical protein